jgi:3-hydroxyisobutyrate dehydrogenase-like beta-hydroxyacid dehydrogenase
MSEEKLKKDLARVKRELQNSNMLNEQLEKEIEKMKKNFFMIVNLASEMRYLLQDCRQAMLPMQLAKGIDAVLTKAKEMD